MRERLHHALLFFTAALALIPAGAVGKGKAEHVVVVVWDGMRPDFIMPQHCPTLYSLAADGVFFNRNHSTYITSTEVNGTSLATGVYPGRSGILANSEYQPQLSVLSTFGTESLDAVRRGDLLTDGNYIRTATLPEILQDAGIATITAGAKPVVLLHDRSWRKASPVERQSVTLFEGKTLPRAAGENLPKVNDDKPFPGTVTHPNSGQDNWTTRSLIRSLWRNGVPKYTLLWLSEPDKSQHETGVGSSTALAAIEISDKNLAEVIKALKEKRVYDKTDIIVVSDHGFSTIQKGPKILDALKRVGFTAAKKFDNPEPGDVMVVDLGGSVMFYVVDRTESVIQQLVEFLQTSDFAGVIFSRLKIDGTFPLDAVRYGSTNNAPDVLISLRWSAERNDYGAPGMMYSMDGTRGKGSHASLSAFDTRNTLVAAGPDFKKGFLNNTPSGNIDVTPTVLWILGVPPPAPVDGRVLHEALVGSNESVPKVVERRIEATRQVGFFRWSQYLKYSQVGHTVYYNEGNGEPRLGE